jgi:hypothetical protein
MADDPVRIAQFWQAVEIFSPQSLPRLEKNRTVDLQSGDPVPWEQRSRRGEAKAGYTWRHEVYGGLYELSRVRDVLVNRYGQDREEEPPPTGKSALFACSVDSDGFLVPGSMVVSACAWGIGQVSRGASPIGDMAANTERYADNLTGQPKVRTGVRVLGAAIRGAVPDGAGDTVGAAAAELRTPPGPIAAGAPDIGEPADVDDGTHGQAARPDLTTITGLDLHAFISWLADQLGVADCLRPRYVRIRSREVKIDSDEETQAGPFLNSFLADDLKLVTDALRAGDFGRALASYLTPEDRVDAARRTDVRRDPGYVLASCQPDLIPPGRWVTAPDRPLVLGQQFAVNRIMLDHGDGDGQPGLFAVNGPPGTGKTTMLRDVVAAILVRRAIKLASLPSPENAFTGKSLAWVTPSWTYHISPLRSELTGDEIVVASSNNAAVENVTAEIPGPGGVADQWREAAREVDYFAATAGNISGDGAWALMAAVLGNSSNRGAFVTNFWHGGNGKQERTGDGLRDVLKTAPVPDWRSAPDLPHCNRLAAARWPRGQCSLAPLLAPRVALSEICGLTLTVPGNAGQR